MESPFTFQMVTITFFAGKGCNLEHETFLGKSSKKKAEESVTFSELGGGEGWGRATVGGHTP